MLHSRTQIATVTVSSASVFKMKHLFFGYFDPERICLDNAKKETQVTGTTFQLLNLGSYTGIKVSQNDTICNFIIFRCGDCQCFRCGRYIGYVTPNIIYRITSIKRTYFLSITQQNLKLVSTVFPLSIQTLRELQTCSFAKRYHILHLKVAFQAP